jgi:hypothetical protein
MAADTQVLSGVRAARTGRSRAWIAGRVVAALPLVVLVLAVLTSAATAALAAKAAELLVPQLSAGARVLFASIAAVVAGIECVAVGPPRQPAEPTRSLAAHAIVLIAHQLTDGARFLVFAIAVATAVPDAAALGGAAGGVGTVLIGALAGEALPAARLRLVRRIIGVLFLLVGAWLMAQALGL